MTDQERQNLRNQLHNLKMHIDAMEEWCQQAMNMIYVIEEKMMDQEDVNLNIYENIRCI